MMVVSILVENGRKKIIDEVKKHGISSNKAIVASQKLDCILNLIHNQSNSSKNPNNNSFI
jgi:hypothetical protein